MQLNSIEEIIDDIRLGRPVILMDDEDRENEGDLVVAAEKITPELVNFMTREARGLLCLTLTGERCDFLGLSPMVDGPSNGSGFSTSFTVSIEAATGITTGISAQDRSRTIRVAVDPLSKPSDIVQPGHVFPLRAKPGGVLSRAGHTEASCDLVRLSGLTPAAAIIEIMNEDGTMARRPDLELFAEEHRLKIGTIADLIHYRMTNEKTVERVAQHTLNTDFGEFEMVVYRNTVSGSTHIALSKGYITRNSPATVRVHAMEPFRDLLCAHPPGGNNSWPLHKVMAKVASEGRGVIVLLGTEPQPDLGTALERFTEGKVVGDSPSGAYQTIGTGSQILRDMGVGKMKLLSSPVKFAALSGFDLEIVEYIPFTD